MCTGPYTAGTDLCVLQGALQIGRWYYMFNNYDICDSDNNLIKIYDIQMSSRLYRGGRECLISMSKIAIKDFGA